MAGILPADFNLGGAIGKGMGTGLSSGLNTMAQFKIQDIMQRQNQSKLGDAYKQLGLPESISRLPEHIQQAYVQDFLMNNPQVYQQQGMLGNMDQMQQLQQSQLQYPKNTEQQMLSQLGQILQRPQGNTNLNDIMPKIMQGQFGIQDKAQEDWGKDRNLLNLQQNDIQQQEPQVQRTIAPSTLTKRYSIPTGLSAVQRGKYIQDVLKEERTAEKEDRKSSILAKEEINKKYKSAVESNKRLARMKELVEGKNLNRPRTAALVNFIKAKGWGPDLSNLLTEESQEYDKLLQGFLPDAKAMFGIRMTDTDLKEFMKGMPDLMKSRGGKRRMLHNMEIVNDTAILRKKVGDMIIRDNGNKVPNDLENLIDKRASKQLTALAEKFKAGFKKPINKTKPTKSLLNSEIPGKVTRKFMNFALGKG
jgi:hypothetical protein